MLCNIDERLLMLSIQTTVHHKLGLNQQCLIRGSSHSLLTSLLLCPDIYMMMIVAAELLENFGDSRSLADTNYQKHS